jgi:hypothetical protein
VPGPGTKARGAVVAVVVVEASAIAEPAEVTTSAVPISVAARRRKAIRTRPLKVPMDGVEDTGLVFRDLHDVDMLVVGHIPNRARRGEDLIRQRSRYIIANWSRPR